MSNPLADAVNIVVTLAGAQVTRAGFGVLMLLSNTGNAWATQEVTRVYGSPDAVLVDFPATTPEYQAASAYFAQSPTPQSLIIGKGTHKPPKEVVLSVLAVVATKPWTSICPPE